MKAAPLLYLVIGFLCIGVSATVAWHYCEPAKELMHAKSMVVVVPSYNNSKWCERSVTKLLCQKTVEFQTVYVNDCSDDDTEQKVITTAQKWGHKPYRIANDFSDDTHDQLKQALQRGESFILISNKDRSGVLANLYFTIQACPDGAIIVDHDGDDWLKHDHVLARIAREYEDSSIWMTYGQYEVYPEGYLGGCREVPGWVQERNAYRSYKPAGPFTTTHLRTFKAGLFKRIKKEDLMYEDAFFDVTGDMAFIFPMLEMANGHIRFIPDVLYVYNQANPINDWKIKFERQQYFERYIRNMPRYEPVKEVVAA